MSAGLLEIAQEAALKGSQILLRQFRERNLQIQIKSENDFVTSADRASEEAIVGHLMAACPGHRILSEEAGLVGTESSDYEWIVDPLDGTTNFLQGLPIWAISIACRQGGSTRLGVVVDPIGDNMFTALQGEGAWWNGKRVAVSARDLEKGWFLATGYPFRAKGALDVYLEVFREVFLRARSIRRCGAAALDLAYTAAGVYDGFFEFRLSPWDIAAGALLIEEAGGVVTDLDGGDRYLVSGNVVAGAAPIHSRLLAAIRKHASEDIVEHRAP